MNQALKIFLWVSGFVAVILLVYFSIANIGVNTPSYHRTTVQKVYFADHISPAHRTAINKFNKKYSGKIEVIPVDLPFNKFSTNERKELLARSLRSKSDRLDVFSVDYIWTPRFAKWCEDLNPYFPQNEQKNILPPAIRSCVIDGRLVAMPMYIDIGMMYYRKDLIDKLPNAAAIEMKLKESISWNDLLALRSPLGYADQPYYIFQANDYEGLICNYFEIIEGLDANYFSGNTVNLQSPTALKALRFLIDLVHEKNVSPAQVVEFDENMSYEFMLKNNAVFVRGWPNFLENYRKIYPDTSKFSVIERAALPHFPGQPPRSVYGGWNLMVSKFSTKKEAAIEFVRFMQTEEAQKIMFELGGYIPVNQKVYRDSAYLSLHPDLRYYHRLVDNGFHRPFIEDYTRISDIISYFVHRAIKGEMTAEEALAKASAMIDSKALLIR